MPMGNIERHVVNDSRISSSYQNYDDHPLQSVFCLCFFSQSLHSPLFDDAPFEQPARLHLTNCAALIAEK